MRGRQIRGGSPQDKFKPFFCLFGWFGFLQIRSPPSGHWGKDMAFNERNSISCC